MAKKLPLYDTHIELGGKIVEFGGYLMPVQYGEGVIAEHNAVRTKAGLFDVSHMGELRLSGPDAFNNIQRIFTTDITNMKDGDVKYGMFCNEKGGVVDDLVVYRFKSDDYLLVVNAGNREKDASWVESHLEGEYNYSDDGDKYGQIAIQGPKSKEILSKLCDEELLPKVYYTFTKDVKINVGTHTIEAIVSQTGYTGEFGYEIYCDATETISLWKALLEAGKEFGLIPCGLGARDTLRLEASMPLYGHELSEEITPKMAGLPCKLDGKDFIGKDALIALGTPTLKRVGLKIIGRGIVREHCDIYSMEGEKIGFTSSGTFCPYLNSAMAMGYVPVEFTEIGTHLNIDVRGRKIEAEIVKMPFYKAEKK